MKKKKPPTNKEYFVCLRFSREGKNRQDSRELINEIARGYSHTGQGTPKSGIHLRFDKKDDLGDYAYRFEQLSQAQGFSDEVSSLEYVIWVELGTLTTNLKVITEKIYESTTVKNG